MTTEGTGGFESAPSKAEILEKVISFLEGWDFGDDEMQAEANELLKHVQEWQTEGLALLPDME